MYLLLLIVFVSQVNAQTITCNVKENETLSIDIPVGNVIFIPTLEGVIKVTAYGIKPSAIKLIHNDKTISLTIDKNYFLSDKSSVKLEEFDEQLDKERQTFTLIKNGRVVSSSSDRAKSIATNENESIKYMNTNAYQLDIVLPSKTNVNLKTGLGSVSCNRMMNGNITIKTEKGDIVFSDVIGDIVASTATGKIIYGEINGTANLNSEIGNIETGTIYGQAEITASGGNIKILSAKDNLVSKTKTGNIDVFRSQKNATLSTNMGDVRVLEAMGELHIKTENGNIDVGKTLNATTLESNTGMIKVGNVFHSLQAKTKIGDIEVFLHNTKGNAKKITIETSIGNILGVFQSKIKGNLTASIANGGLGKYKIIANFIPQKDFTSPTELTYDLNGGNETSYSLKTTKGNIFLSEAK